MEQLLSIFSLKFLSWGISGVSVFLLILVFCLFKFPNGTKLALKIFGALVLFVGLPISAVFGVVNVNGYYSAEGGIFGQIKKSLGINIGTVSSDTFEVSGLNLRLDENGEYSAVITVDLADESVSGLKLDSSKNYAILVNRGLTTDNFKAVTGDSIAMSAKYTYSFLDYDRGEMLKDTLKISFVVNKNDVVCRLSTAGGATARDLWKLYFKKNGMTFKFVEANYIPPANPSEGEGDISQFCILSFYDDSDLVVTKFVVRGTNLSDVPTYSKEGYFFEGWSLDKETLFDFVQKIDADMVFYAKLSNTVTFNIESISSSNPFTFEVASYDNGLNKGYLERGISICSIPNDYKGMTVSKLTIKISKLIVRDAEDNQFYFSDANDLKTDPCYCNKEISGKVFFALKINDYAFISTLNAINCTDERINIGIEYFLSTSAANLENGLGLDLVSIEISAVTITMETAVSE